MRHGEDSSRYLQRNLHSLKATDYGGNSILIKPTRLGQTYSKLQRTLQLQRSAAATEVAV